MTDQPLTLDDLQHDPENARVHDDRNLDMIQKSLEEVGAWRSIGIDEDDTVFMGNGVIEAAKQAGINKVRVVESSGDEIIAVRRRGLTPEQKRRAALFDNRTSDLSSFDPACIAALAEQGTVMEDLFTAEEMAVLLESTADKPHKIGRGGRLYNAGDGHNVEPFKLAYRVEAAWKAKGNLAIDVYSGEGQLAAWYRRRFGTVITNDKAMSLGDVDYQMDARDFIGVVADQYIEFDFIDFDDEGCPAREIRNFFDLLSDRKKETFVLCLTDSNGLNMKCRGKLDFADVYLADEMPGMRKCTSADYEAFEGTVTSFIVKVATRARFVPTRISSYRGREGNIIYQTWLIVPA